MPVPIIDLASNERIFLLSDYNIKDTLKLLINVLEVIELIESVCYWRRHSDYFDAFLKKFQVKSGIS